MFFKDRKTKCVTKCGLREYYALEKHLCFVTYHCMVVPTKTYRANNLFNY